MAIGPVRDGLEGLVDIGITDHDVLVRLDAMMSP
jgi:hypothetical protein